MYTKVYLDMTKKCSTKYKLLYAVFGATASDTPAHLKRWAGFPVRKRENILIMGSIRDLSDWRLITAAKIFHGRQPYFIVVKICCFTIACMTNTCFRDKTFISVYICQVYYTSSLLTPPLTDLISSKTV